MNQLLYMYVINVVVPITILMNGFVNIVRMEVSNEEVNTSNR